MRKEESQFVENSIFEGMVSIRSIIYAMDNNISDRKIEKVLYDKNKAKKHYKEIGYLKAVSSKYSFKVEETDQQTIDSLTTGSTHGGIIAICSPRQFLFPSDIEKNGFYVLIDGVEDPYNFGYSVRSIYASGANGIILSERNWMSSAGVVCRSSAGASERIKMYSGDTQSILEIFKNLGYKIIAAEKDNSVSAYDSDLSNPILLVVGGEKRGNSKCVLDMCDFLVHLDYGRDFPEALSTASAASILSFEIMRQNKYSKKKYFHGENR